MREKNVKEIVRYYYEIPEMVRLLKTEQREQESLYDTLKAATGCPAAEALGSRWRLP